MGQAVRAGDLAGGEGLSDLAAPVHAGGRRQVPGQLAGDGCVFPRCAGQAQAGRHGAEEPQARTDAARYRAARRGCAVRRADRAGHRYQGQRQRQPGLAVDGGPARLPGQAARAGLHRLQALEDLRHAAAVVGRYRDCADPGHAAGAGDQEPQVRTGGAQAAKRQYARAGGSQSGRGPRHCRSRPPGLCRPRPVRGGCRFRADRCGWLGQPELPRVARRADRRQEHGQGAAGRAAGARGGVCPGPLAAAHFHLADRRGR
ncbi:hypothetical protein D9M70_501620 [compost metagenome]